MFLERWLRGSEIVSGLCLPFPGRAVELGESPDVRFERRRDGLWGLALVRRRMTCGKEEMSIVKKQSISLQSTT